MPGIREEEEMSDWVSCIMPDGKHERDCSEVYLVVASRLASLVAEKNAAYGDSFGQSGKVLAILYPNGIPVEHLGTALTLVRVIDKLFRIATDPDAFGENPWQDIGGYALLELAKKEKSPR